jgi:hypothetical protein
LILFWGHKKPDLEHMDLTLVPWWCDKVLYYFLENLQWCSACNRAELFFTSKFSYFTFLQPPPIIKPQTSTPKIGGQVLTNNKPPGRIIMMGRSETPCNCQIIIITLISAGAHDCCAFHQPLQIVQLC